MGKITKMKKKKNVSMTLNISVAVKRLGGSGTYCVLTSSNSSSVYGESSPIRYYDLRYWLGSWWSVGRGGAGLANRSSETPENSRPGRKAKSRLFRRYRRLRTTTTADTMTPRVFHRRRHAERSTTIVFAELYRRRSRRSVISLYSLLSISITNFRDEYTGDRDHGTHHSRQCNELRRYIVP